MALAAGVLRRFLREVGRDLVCYHSTKKRLLRGLALELRDFAHGDEQLSIGDLVKNFGCARDVAAQLQEGVSAEEYANVRKRKRLFILACAAAVGIVLFGFAALLMDMMSHVEVKVTERIIDVTRW